MFAIFNLTVLTYTSHLLLGYLRKCCTNIKQFLNISQVLSRFLPLTYVHSFLGFRCATCLYIFVEVNYLFLSVFGLVIKFWQLLILYLLLVFTITTFLQALGLTSLAICNGLRRGKYLRSEVLLVFSALIWTRHVPRNVTHFFSNLHNFTQFLALDPAEESRLNKILHKKLEEVQDAEVKIDMRNDPRSPLFSNQTFETLNL